MATAAIYGNFFLALGNKEHDLLDDVLKCMMTTSSYSPNQDTHDYKNDVTNEVTGTNYTATGVTLASKVFNYTAGTNIVMLDADNPSWASSTITNARNAVFYNSTPGADSSRGLISYVNFGGDVSTIAGLFQITLSASGLLRVTVGAEA